MFDQSPGPRKKIAIIGAGISGLSAAYYLSVDHDVTIYEASPTLGGHARTLMAGRNMDQPVDTGFIVFNRKTYPFLCKLFEELDVPIINSDMSFSAQIDNGKLEYGTSGLRSAFAQKSNIFKPKFYKMLADIYRFARTAEGAVKPNQTIEELSKDLKLGDWFLENFLLPFCGAIWSTPVLQVRHFPADTLIRFFKNHGLFANQAPHQWLTVDGGSIEYVKRIEAQLRVRGCEIKTSSPVNTIKRGDFGVSIQVENSPTVGFDDVIFACHSDQALAILGDDASPNERSSLGNIGYQKNTAVLHCDVDQMPSRRECWASWSYRSDSNKVGVTYWMNRLQNIPNDDPLFVTLNPTKPIPASKTYDVFDFHHPLFDQAAIQAQGDIADLQGENHTWFAGAWNANGFHEDGIASAVTVVDAIRGLDRTATVSNIPSDTVAV
ncbi:MAG: NAD(P)/FAD-dependent oxidoreductase [Planktomarina sp.]